MSNYYDRCMSGMGRAIEIRTHDGRVHRGIIGRVTRNKVYLRPMGRSGNYGGFSYGYYRGNGGYDGYGWGWGFASGVALGAIASLAFIPFFFW